jgi:hypothetical protein
VPALEPAPSWRVVALPQALDAARWLGDDVDVLRIAPDEALGLGATGVEVDGDPEAIIEPDAGFSVSRLDERYLDDVIDHSDWEVPLEPGSIVQGKIAGVPAKLRIGDPSLLVVQVAYADDLRSRLGW